MIWDFQQKGGENLPKNDSTLLEKANCYGTPMYVYDGEALKDHYDHITAWLHQSAEVFFSFKSNGNVSIASLLQSFGAGIEVASAGELLMAVKAGYSPTHIIFSGPENRSKRSMSLFSMRSIVLSPNQRKSSSISLSLQSIKTNRHQ